MGFLSIAIKSGDTNTVVFLDGQRLGKAPLVWKATPGRHVVSVQRAGTTFAPASMPVTVTLHDTVRAVFASAASVPKN